MTQQADEVAAAAPAPRAEEPQPVTPAAGETCSHLPLEARVEALLLAAERPMTTARLAAVLGLPARGAAARVDAAIEALNGGYRESSRAFRAQRLAGGWQLMTQPEFHPLLEAMQAERQQTSLSPAAMETLAIIAYRQPIMRAEVEAIRGVSSGEVLRGLLERRLARIAGRAEELGRPMLYGTTREFLKIFGLASLDDLPAVEGAARPSAARTAPPPEAPGDLDAPDGAPDDAA
jgi:segregation and condensation protein B